MHEFEVVDKENVLFANIFLLIQLSRCIVLVDAPGQDVFLHKLEEVEYKLIRITV